MCQKLCIVHSQGPSITQCHGHFTLSRGAQQLFHSCLSIDCCFPVSFISFFFSSRSFPSFLDGKRGEKKYFQHGMDIRGKIN